MVSVIGVNKAVRHINSTLVHFVGKLQRGHNIIDPPVIPPLIARFLSSKVISLLQHVLQLPIRTHKLQNIIHILQMALQKVDRLFKGLICGIDNLRFVSFLNQHIAAGKQQNKNQDHRAGKGYGKLNPHGQAFEIIFIRDHIFSQVLVLLIF